MQRKLDRARRYKDVSEWKSKQDFCKKAELCGNSTFIAWEPHQECDLFFLSKPGSGEIQRTRATWNREQRLWTKNNNASPRIRIFTTFTRLVPLKCESILDVETIVEQCLKLLRRTPQSIYMHSDGACSSKEIKEDIGK